ncbi:hypothetical protein Gohar_010091 [Gossypium harknessii]|uniref:Uncharacterized protein n=1 Tax=Gossypium harknessii TaxID=34285 RepID=A0A7J9GPU0_9ROSI|nr:hypothetical protein [Gossypium harknessii]
MWIRVTPDQEIKSVQGLLFGMIWGKKWDQVIMSIPGLIQFVWRRRLRSCMDYNLSKK